MLTVNKAPIKIKGTVLNIKQNVRGKFVTSIMIGENDIRHYILNDKLDVNSFYTIDGYLN